MTDGLRIEQIKQSLVPQVDKEGPKSSGNTGKADQGTVGQALQLSSSAQDVQFAQQTLRSAPENVVRQQQIQDLQQQIDQGQLNVIPDLLVQKIMAQIFP